MPRRKLSEYRAKQILTAGLEIDYAGWSNADDIPNDGSYVVKVDQAVKKRFKNGLVGLQLQSNEVQKWIDDVHDKGYESFIIEPYREHEQSDERYLNVMRDTRGLHLSYSSHGGVDIEDQTDTLETVIIDEGTDWSQLAEATSLSIDQLHAVVNIFVDNYFTLLEINPYIVSETKLQLLDVAVEVDDTAILLVDSWNEKDLRYPPRVLSEEEKTVALLGESSSASFALQMINPNGSLFVLLSGGGASVTVCDEIYSAGYGVQLANYGEYSGNPTQEEAYIYTSAVIKSLLRSSASKKALFIGGAVANFTDIAMTFTGVTKAIDEFGKQLHQQGVRIVVRRGGPNQKKGLQNIKDVLDNYELTVGVYDQATTLDMAVERVIQEVS
ncbi:MAG: ATP citrate lyase citrate-binding domain-containing protein [Candidatus Saccharimonadales bacterium]